MISLENQFINVIYAFFQCTHILYQTINDRNKSVKFLFREATLCQEIRIDEIVGNDVIINRTREDNRRFGLGEFVEEIVIDGVIDLQRVGVVERIIEWVN